MPGSLKFFEPHIFLIKYVDLLFRGDETSDNKWQNWDLNLNLYSILTHNSGKQNVMKTKT
jgi:hypothetical protein